MSRKDCILKIDREIRLIKELFNERVLRAVFGERNAQQFLSMPRLKSVTYNFLREPPYQEEFCLTEYQREK